MASPPKRRLGRGLAALIGDDASEEAVIQAARSLRHVPVEFLQPSRNNPRKIFKAEDLQDLARSVEQKGMLQPLVVRPLDDGRSFEIVAGERRWRAAQLAGLHDVPVLIRDLSDAETLEIALIENIQRSDLNPLEEARGYAQLIDEFGYTQQQLADSLGRSRSHIANTLRLMTLPPAVLDHVEAGRLSAGHARALVASGRAEDLAERIVRQGLSVRDAETLARKAQKPSGGKATAKPATAAKSADIRALERSLVEALGLAVDIDHTERSGGTIRIGYKTLEQLEAVCAALRRSR